jgi:hypothetical protein
MESAADTATMLGEMATIGTAMLVGSVLVWAGMVLLYNRYSVEAPVAQTA